MDIIGFRVAAAVVVVVGVFSGKVLNIQIICKPLGYELDILDIIDARGKFISCMAYIGP